MPREYPEFPLVGVGVLVWHEQRVLLVQRGKQPNYGLWSIPGGLIELGETLEQAARREIREECGVEITPPTILTTIDIFDYDDGGKLRYHYILLEMTAELVSGEAQAGDDALALRWVGLNELDQLDLIPRTADVIRLAYAQLP